MEMPHFSPEKVRTMGRVYTAEDNKKIRLMRLYCVRPTQAEHLLLFSQSLTTQS